MSRVRGRSTTGTGCPDRFPRPTVGLLLLLLPVGMLLAGCAAGPNELQASGPDVPGFWLGLWHGVISPVTFVISLFTDDVSIYAVRNSGNWYDFGFVLGAGILFGGSGVRRRRG